MKARLQLILLAAAAVYMGWGLALLLAPEAAHPLLSTGPYDPVMTALFGVALVAFAAGFVIGARDPVKEVVRVAVVAQLLLGAVVAFLMFVAATLPRSPVTLISLCLDIAAGGLLFLLEARLDLARHHSKAVKTQEKAAKTQAQPEKVPGRREAKPTGRRRASYSRG